MATLKKGMIRLERWLDVVSHDFTRSEGNHPPGVRCSRYKREGWFGMSGKTPESGNPEIRPTEPAAAAERGDSSQCV